ncbi:MAG TPA: large conductance mechanosensitive channel protein MscL [Actinomycetota bacterium]|nr:large conductance mechanosensitive channel protein MscL [Actinomycetota bacterium]
MKGVFKEFKEFAFKGNMLDLAIGFIIGAAFSAVVTALSKGVLMQVISAVFGKADFGNVKFSIRRTPILVGDLITALINFLIIAAVLFMLVKAINKAMVKPKAVEEKKSKDCPYCLTPIPLAATKCPACTSTVEPVPAS